MLCSLGGGGVVEKSAMLKGDELVGTCEVTEAFGFLEVRGSESEFFQARCHNFKELYVRSDYSIGRRKHAE